MKFDYASDIHLEFGGIADLFFHPEMAWKKNPDSTVLILAGDIVEVVLFDSSKGGRSGLVQESFAKLSSLYDHVLWVFGNHEYYGETLEFAVGHARKRLEKLGLKNFHILENQEFQYDGVSFYGGTMWTSFDNNNPLEQMRFYNMNDSKCIKCYDAADRSWKRTITANDVAGIHAKYVRKLHKFLSDTDGPKVVISHHAPSAIVISDEYRGHPMNSCYIEELSDVISYAQPKAWVFGHLHNGDYIPKEIGNTKLLSNTRGYFNYDKFSIGFQPKQFEV